MPLAVQDMAQHPLGQPLPPVGLAHRHKIKMRLPRLERLGAGHHLAQGGGGQVALDEAHGLAQHLGLHGNGITLRVRQPHRARHPACILCHRHGKALRVQHGRQPAGHALSVLGEGFEHIVVCLRHDIGDALAVSLCTGSDEVRHGVPFVPAYRRMV